MTKQNTMRGDTIVEVLIAMTIIAFVLGASFSLSGRSTKNTIEARERSEALKLVEGQIEILKSKRTTDPTLGSYQTGSFCFQTAAPQSKFPSTDTANCTVSGPGYRLSIVYTAIAHSSGTPDPGYYTFSAVWDSLKGGQNNASLDYRP